MLELLKRFAALSLMTGIVTSLLPEGTLKKTAGMLIGLLMLLCWADGLEALLSLPDAAPIPGTMLAPTDTALTETAAHVQNTLLSRWEAAR